LADLVYIKLINQKDLIFYNQKKIS